jgi:hypothetical protein
MEHAAAASETTEQATQLLDAQLLGVLLRHSSFRQDSSVLLPLLQAQSSCRKQQQIQTHVMGSCHSQSA